MQKKPAEKKYRKRLISLSPEADAALTKKSKRENKPKSAVIADSLLDVEPFAEDVEWMIQRACASTGLSRKKLLERAVVELSKQARV